jgi:hypothetical protein
LISRVLGIIESINERRIIMATYREVVMLSGRVGYTVRYFYGKKFFFYTVLDKAEAASDCAMLNNIV